MRWARWSIRHMMLLYWKYPCGEFGSQQCNVHSSCILCTISPPWHGHKVNSISTFVSFIPYFRLLVFGILVTLVVWFLFFPSCPSCLAKCKQRLSNIFVTLLPKVTKNQKRKMGWTKYKSIIVLKFQKYFEKPEEDNNSDLTPLCNC